MPAALGQPTVQARVKVTKPDGSVIEQVVDLSPEDVAALTAQITAEKE